MAPTPRAGSIDEFRQLAEAHDLHTVELAAPDTQGHLRGKRIPASRFFDGVHASGANIADAMFVFDMANDLPDNEFINMDTGYLDCHLVPDNATGRILGHRPGYGLVFADAVDHRGEPHPLAPRTVLTEQVERCRAAGLDPLVATEMEFYLCRPDWSPVQDHIQYSSLTDMPELEPVLAAMRDALMSAGMEVESSNAEYGPGQVEINAGPTDALTAADNAALFKSIVKQVASQHDLRATFMPKPWTEHSGSGMHIHMSLTGDDGGNAFASSGTDSPNELMRHWDRRAAVPRPGPDAARGPHQQRPEADPALHLLPDARHVGSRQPHGAGPLHRPRPVRPPTGSSSAAPDPTPTPTCSWPGCWPPAWTVSSGSPTPARWPKATSTPTRASTCRCRPTWRRPSRPTRTVLWPSNSATCSPAASSRSPGPRSTWPPSTTPIPMTSTTGSGTASSSTADRTMSGPAPAPDVTSSSVYARGLPHEAFAAMRATPGLTWHPYEGGGFWAVTRHADIRGVSRNAAVFSSAIGHTNLWAPGGRRPRGPVGR